MESTNLATGGILGFLNHPTARLGFLVGAVQSSEISDSGCKFLGASNGAASVLCHQHSKIFAVLILFLRTATHITNGSSAFWLGA